MSLIRVAYRFVNQALRPVGLRLQTLHHPTRSFGTFCDHLAALGVHIQSVIDVGVASGTPALYRALPRARYWLVEPVEENRPTLERLAGQLNAEIVLAAAGAENGTTVLHVHDDLSGSSALRQAEGALLDGVTRTVPVVRLDSVLPPVLPRPALLKIDTQGTELDVIRGLGERVREIDVMIVETPFMAFRDGAPVFADVVRFLDDLGFAVYEVLEGEMRALDGAMAQVDLVFVPADSPLRKDQRFFNDQQAAAYAQRWRSNGTRRPG